MEIVNVNKYKLAIWRRYGVIKHDTFYMARFTMIREWMLIYVAYHEANIRTYMDHFNVTG